jgi:hypothetical protein
MMTKCVMRFLFILLVFQNKEKRTLCSDFALISKKILIAQRTWGWLHKIHSQISFTEGADGIMTILTGFASSYPFTHQPPAPTATKFMCRGWNQFTTAI